jgi:hypothetical protein
MKGTGIILWGDNLEESGESEEIRESGEIREFREKSKKKFVRRNGILGRF